MGSGREQPPHGVAQERARAEVDDDEEDMAQEEEGRAQRCMRDPCAPTAAERAAHNATHMPFRNWCPFCVAGRGEAAPHKQTENLEVLVPEVQLDYGFLKKEEEEALTTLLITKDRQSRAIFVNVVQNKGRGQDNTVQRVVANVRRLGHRGRLTIKVDNENALLDLREAVMVGLEGTCTPLRPPVGEHQSSGSIEDAVKLVKGLVRVHHRALENAIGASIPSRHPIFTWLAEHVGDILTKYTVGKDGRTPYERLIGRKVREELLSFGEQVWYKKKRGSVGDLDSQWGEGIWVGRRWGTVTNLILTSEGALEARDIRRRPDPEKWSRQAIEAVRATPWCWHPDSDMPITVLPPLPGKESEEAKEIPEPSIPVPRSFYIIKEDLQRFGYTVSCRRCMRMRAGHSVHGVPHTEQCRRRLELAMQEAGDQRAARAEERQRDYQERKAAMSSIQDKRDENIGPSRGGAPAPAPCPEEHQPQAALDQPAAAASQPDQLHQPATAARVEAVASQPDQQIEAAEVASAAQPQPASHDSAPEEEAVWCRTDPRARRFYLPYKVSTAPDWRQVTHRSTFDTTNGKYLEEKVAVANMAEGMATRPLPYQCDTQTFFYYKKPPQAGPRAERVEVEVNAAEGGAQGKFLETLGRLIRASPVEEVPKRTLHMLARTRDLLVCHGMGEEEAAAAITELYSPPRVTAQILPGERLCTGGTYDLIRNAEGVSWDFSKSEDRQRARKEIAATRPYLVIGSPPCTWYSIAQRYNQGRLTAAEWRRRDVEAYTHLTFAFEIYHDRSQRGVALFARTPSVCEKLDKSSGARNV